MSSLRNLCPPYFKSFFVLAEVLSVAPGIKKNWIFVAYVTPGMEWVQNVDYQNVDSFSIGRLVAVDVL